MPELRVGKRFKLVPLRRVGGRRRLPAGRYRLSITRGRTTIYSKTVRLR